MSGWGSGAWGSGAWGAGVGTGISIAGAFPLAQTIVRVSLNGIARAASPTGAGDALNPATWTVEYFETTWKPLTVITVTRIDASTFDVQTLEPLKSQFVQHRVSSTTLVSFIGTLITPPTSATFNGIGIAPLTVVTPGRPVDFKYTSTPNAETAGGQFVISSSFDYALEGYEETVKKLIIRRLTTPKGGFKHLPEYGFGLSAKTTYNPTQLAELQRQIERAVRQEFGVVAASVSLSQSRDGILTVRIVARIRNGSEINVSVQRAA
jgi:phage baseplate assembly protein W